MYMQRGKKEMWQTARTGNSPTKLAILNRQKNRRRLKFTIKII